MINLSRQPAVALGELVILGELGYHSSGQKIEDGALDRHAKGRQKLTHVIQKRRGEWRFEIELLLLGTKNDLLGISVHSEFERVPAPFVMEF